jgi:uncharacterized Zn-binding protein involved in type VI secretion
MAVVRAAVRLVGTGAMKVVALVNTRILRPASITTQPPQMTQQTVGNFSPPIPIPPGTTAPSSSGKGISVRASDQAGGQQTGQSLQNFVNVEKLLAVVKGDKVNEHGSDKHGNQPKMAEGSEFFKIAGIPTCRQGHKADCGHETTGRSWFHINDTA